jgi:hypothetical protein
LANWHKSFIETLTHKFCINFYDRQQPWLVTTMIGMHFTVHQTRAKHGQKSSWNWRRMKLVRVYEIADLRRLIKFHHTVKNLRESLKLNCEWIKNFHTVMHRRITAQIKIKDSDWVFLNHIDILRAIEIHRTELFW